MGKPSSTSPPTAPKPRNVTETQARKLFNVTLTYLTEIHDILSSSDPARSQLTDALEPIMKTTAFRAARPMFANGSMFASTLQALNTLSTRATTEIHAPTAHAPNAPSSRPAPTTADEITDFTDTTPPYLRAIKAPPAPLRRLPVIRVHNAASEIPESTPLARSLLSRATRTANRIIGRDPPQLMKLRADAPLRGARDVREALNQGGLPGPSVVIPTTDARTVYLLATPSTLECANRSYERFSSICERQNITVPRIEMHPVEDFNETFNSTTSVRNIFPALVAERQRLLNPTIKWRPKTFFAARLSELTTALRDRLQQLEPNAPELASETPETTPRSETLMKRPREDDLHVEMDSVEERQ